MMQSGGGESTEGSQEGGAGTRKRRGTGAGQSRKARKPLRVGELTKEDSEPKVGGGGTSPGTLTQLASTRVEMPGGKAPPDPTGTDSKLTQAGAPVGDKAPATTGGGSSKTHAPVKVVLGAKKKAAGKVILAAAKPAAAALAKAGSAGKTRKSSARKVRVSMKSLSRKIDKAKKIRKHSTEDDLPTIKKALHKAGLIKAESKAPEPILRQMYADFMTLKSRAL